MLSTQAARRVFKMIPTNCNKLIHGYVRNCIKNKNLPLSIIQMFLIYGCLFETLESIITSIIIAIISNDTQKTGIMLFNLRYILLKQEGPQSWPKKLLQWPEELLLKLSYTTILLT